MQSSHFRQNATATACPAIIFARLPHNHNTYSKKSPRTISHIHVAKVKEEYVCFGLCTDLCMLISKLISCDHEGGGGGGGWGLFPKGSLRILTLAAFTQWLWAHKLGQRDKLTTARS